MKKLFFLIFALGFISLQAQDVNITFQVNMGETADFDAATDSVWVVMDGDADWNFTEYYGMADVDADGIYSYTLTVASGGAEVVQQYSYGYGPTAATYKHWETPPSACANDLDYREVTLPADQGDVTLPAVYYGTCSDVLGGVSVTFQVDMTDVADLYAGGAVWLNLDNWTDWKEMIDDDGDKVYEITLSYMELDVVKYIFSYQSGADPDNDFTDEVVPAECATDGQRVFTVGADDQVLPAIKLGECSDQVNITFQLDMSDISDLAGAVWFNVNGDWTDWYDMTDAGGGLFTVTTPYSPGDVVFYTYGYQNGPDPDNDFVDELVPEACGGTFGVRRYLVGPTDATVPVHKFNACPDDLPELVEITFSVDMSNETVGDQLVWQVIKSPWFWNQLSLSGDDIYMGKVKVHKGQSFPYTFLIGDMDAWDGEESVPTDCNFGTESAPERRFEGTMKDSVMPVIVFGECIDVSDKYTITFRVDMSGVSDLYQDGFVWVNLDGWTDWYDMTDADSDMVYEYDAEYSDGEVIKYIFSYQTGADPNNDFVDEAVPEACATEGQRIYTVGTANAVLDVVSLGSCTLDTRVTDLVAGEMKLYPNPAMDHLTIQLKDVSSGTLVIRDISGREVISRVFSNVNELSLSVGSLDSEMYIVTVLTETETYREKLLVK